MRWLLSVALLYGSVLSAQERAEIKLRSTIPLPNQELFSADQFGNIYTVSGTEFIKLDVEGQKLFSYSTPLFGDISQVNVFDPLNPYLFYRDANQMVVTDNRLNEALRFNFSEHGYFDVRFLALAGQGLIWFYDQATDKLYQLNPNDGSVSNQSVNITQLTNTENQPTELVSTVGKLYLNIPETGILEFSAVGAFKRKLPLKEVKSFDVAGNYLVALRGDQLIQFNLETSAVQKLLLPAAFSPQQLKFYRNLLYLYDGKKLLIFEIPSWE